MANGNIVSYKDRYESTIARLRALKDAAKAPLAQVVSTASGIAGGVAAGALEAKLPLIGPVPTAPVIGAVAVVGAIMNAEESWAAPLNSFGTTMIGCAAARETYKLLTQNAAAPKLAA